MTRRFIIIGFFILLTACGFHLKGENILPSQLKLLQVIESTDTDFNALLLLQLKSAGVKIVEDTQSALLSVKIEILPEITVVKSSSSGLEIKQLKVRVEYFVKNKAGGWLLKSKRLEQTRDFESDSNQLLAKSNEKQQLYRQMKKNLIRILIYQLQLLK